MRRAGKQYYDSFAAIVFSAHPLSGRAAIGVRKHSSAGDDVRLLQIIRCHLPTAGSEALFETGDDRRIAAKFKSKRVGDRFPREVILGRSKSAHEDDNLSSRYGKTRGSGQTFATVSNNRLENYFHAQLVELFG